MILMQFLSPHCSETPCSHIVFAEKKKKKRKEKKMSHSKSKHKTMKISPFYCHFFIPHLNDLISSCYS